MDLQAALTDAAPATEARRGPNISRPPRRGLVLVFTGNGKGKTTAAMGLAARAVGNRMRVRVLQFIKGQWKSGERESLTALAPLLEIGVAGKGFTIDRLRDPRIPMDEHETAARAGWAQAREIVLSGDYDMVILDEMLGTLKAGFVTVDELLGLIWAKPAEEHLVLTGRGAPPELIAVADLVTEMQPIKHPLEQGIKAQRGIEF